MANFSLSIADIAGKGKKRGGKAKAEGVVQLRDESGNTWSGRGRMPRWLQSKNKEQYRVQ